MNNQNYINHYVEILTGTMTDAAIKNISLQANAKISEEVINDLQAKSKELHQQIENLNSEISKILTVKQEQENKITELNNIKNEYENVKQQVTHVDTFRNELIKERELHQQTKDEFSTLYDLKVKELQQKIDDLQQKNDELAPAKRKKIEEFKVSPVVVTLDTNNKKDSTIRDGGSF